MGVDFSPPDGRITPIFGGTVIYSGWNGEGGNVVIIRHTMEDGRVFYSSYQHLESPSPLKKGDSVGIDTFLGQMGNTGKSDGAHLHLQVFTMVNGPEYDNGLMPYSYSDTSFNGSSVAHGRVKNYDPLEVIRTGGSMIP